MQKQPRSHLYKKLFLGSLAIFIVGFVLAISGLLKLYGTIGNSGFGQTAKSTSSINHIATITKLGGLVTAASFYAGLVFLIMFLVSRSKEK